MGTISVTWIEDVRLSGVVPSRTARDRSCPKPAGFNRGVRQTRHRTAVRHVSLRSSAKRKVANWRNAGLGDATTRRRNGVVGEALPAVSSREPAEIGHFRRSRCARAQLHSSCIRVAFAQLRRRPHRSCLRPFNAPVERSAPIGDLGESVRGRSFNVAPSFFRPGRRSDFWLRTYVRFGPNLAGHMRRREVMAVANKKGQARSAKTGRYVTRATARRRPSTTIVHRGRRRR